MQLEKCDASIGEVVNIGTNSEISIGDLVNLISRLMNHDVEIITDSQRIRPKNSEVYRLLCDNTKLKKLTGFESKYDLMTSKFGSYGEMNKSWSGEDVKGFSKIYTNYLSIYHQVNAENND